jgi:hypothetical protein
MIDSPMPPPEKLDAQTVDMQRWWPFQFLTSLLRRRGGWFANNHALQRTRRERRGCHRCVPCAGSLSLGRWTDLRLWTYQRSLRALV